MIETQSGCIGCKALDCVCVKPNPIHAYIEAVEKRVSEATPGPWTTLRSFGSADCELIAHAPTDLAALTSALRIAVEALEHLKDHCNCPECTDETISEDALASIERIFGGEK